MAGRKVVEVIKEQRVIETLADRHKRLALEWVDENKRFMKSVSELSFTKWRQAVLQKARYDLNNLSAIYLDDTLNMAYELNKLDTIPAKTLTKKQSLAVAGATKTTGKTAKDNLIALMNLSYGILSSESTRYNAQGLTNTQITDAIMGSPAQRYKNGDMIRWINGARTHSTTNVKAGVEAIRQARYENDSDVRGYVWDSVLDGNTSATCQGLNGKRFYFYRVVDGKRVSLSGYKPLPPIHPNCRSSTQPIVNGEPIPQVESFTAWANDPANDKELLEALGPTRYDLYKTGTLKIERFTDARFKPLTIEELIESIRAPSAAEIANRQATL